MECWFLVEKVKGHGHWTSKTSRNCRVSDIARLLTGDGSSVGDSSTNCKLGLFVKPNLLSTA